MVRLALVSAVPLHIRETAQNTSMWWMLITNVESDGSPSLHGIQWGIARISMVPRTGSPSHPRPSKSLSACHPRRNSGIAKARNGCRNSLIPAAGDPARREGPCPTYPPTPPATPGGRPGPGRPPVTRLPRHPASGPGPVDGPGQARPGSHDGGQPPPPFRPQSPCYNAPPTPCGPARLLDGGPAACWPQPARGRRPPRPAPCADGPAPDGGGRGTAPGARPAGLPRPQQPPRRCARPSRGHGRPAASWSIGRGGSPHRRPPAGAQFDQAVIWLGKQFGQIL